MANLSTYGFLQSWILFGWNIWMKVRINNWSTQWQKSLNNICQRRQQHHILTGDEIFSWRNEIKKRHGRWINPADCCWHQLQSQKISPVQLYGTGYRVSFSNTDFGKFEKYQFFMKQGNWDNNSNIEQLNLKSPMVTFVNEVMNDVPWQKMKNCCWEMKEKSNMTNASNWMMSTLWGTKCCVERQENRCYCKCKVS